MDARAVIEMIERHVPFNRLVGAKALEVSAQRAVFHLEQRHEIENHVQTIHAAALFTLCEGTAGAVVACGFDVEHFLLLLKSAEIQYRRVAHNVTASARLTSADHDMLLNTLTERGRVDIPIAVEVHDERDEIVCNAMIVWALRSK